jgi:hypothetical protein
MLGSAGIADNAWNQLTIQSNQQNTENVEQQDSVLICSAPGRANARINIPEEHEFYNSRHCLGRVHGFTSGNTETLRATIFTLDSEYERCGMKRKDSQAKEAVTNTRAKPPNPPTNGASPIRQFSPPI